ncbi:MAG: hypothetical protein M1819_002266 [Sarea resinae]|nr:MAG: hypothetical protein M1819_002266 [Sarea resinae]
MKVISLVFAALLAATSIQAAAAPMPEPDAEAIKHFCHLPGQPCSKAKRAAEAAAAAFAMPEAAPEAEAEPIKHFCHLPGQPCSKAKRSAEALAEAIAEANAL